MSQLSITLSGVIEKSNFDEWKTELVEQIRSVNTELTNDDDFAEATKHVKQFKAAEKNLKEAKKSALKQAEEINQLFEAIDQVSAEARQARLKLDKQIKKRKQEIKQEFIEQGVESINAFIKEQSADFQSLPLSSYNDDDIFADAISGKASTKGMQKAITKICKSIKTAISEKAAIVDANVAILDQLPAHHKALFQDRTPLISQTQEELSTTIDARISAFENVATAEGAADQSEAIAAETNELADTTSESSSVDDADSDKSDYLITIEVSATEKEADEVRSAVVKLLKGNNAVGNITLAAS